MSAEKVVKLLDEVIEAIKELPGGVSLNEVKTCLNHAKSSKAWALRYSEPMVSPAQPEPASEVVEPEPAPVAEEVTEADDSEAEVVSDDE